MLKLVVHNVSLRLLKVNSVDMSFPLSASVTSLVLCLFFLLLILAIWLSRMGV